MATAYDNDARLNALMERLDHGQALSVITARTMAYGYACGRQDEANDRGVSGYGFAVAYALATAEFRAGITVESPTLPDAWAHFVWSGTAVDEYRRRLGEGESRPVTVGQ